MMIYLVPFISFFISALCAVLIMPRLLLFCKHRGLYDMPNERKVHTSKIPRLGGALFMPCAMIGIAVALVYMICMHLPLPEFTVSSVLIFIGVFLIYLIGLLDDVLGLSARIKFLIQFIASLFLPICNLYFNNLYGFMGIYEIPMWVGYPLTIFVCLLIVNSINLIDGIDGLASGLSLIALTAFTVLFYRLDVMNYAMFSMGLMGAVVVFFYFNMFGKVDKFTKTFMGDTGSLILGYALSYLAIKLAMDNDAVLPYRPGALLMSYSLLLIPTFDLIRVALFRLRNGVSIFHADKTHIHHKFLNAGFSMHMSLVAILCMQLIFCVMNVLLYRLGLSFSLIVVLDILLFTVIQIVLTRMSKRCV